MTQKQLQELKAVLRENRSLSSEIGEAHFVVVGLSLGKGKFTVDGSDVFFVSGLGNEILIGEIHNNIPRSGILLDYFYMRHYVGHVHAMIVVNQYIEDTRKIAQRHGLGGAA